MKYFNLNLNKQEIEYLLEAVKSHTDKLEYRSLFDPDEDEVERMKLEIEFSTWIVMRLKREIEANEGK